MAAADSGVARCNDLSELYAILRRNPSCRFKKEVEKRIKQLKGQKRQLDRNGGHRHKIRA